jgi:hypothetical protein
MFGEAKIRPESANGSAKTVCSSLIISDHSLKSPFVDGLAAFVALLISGFE